MNHPADKVISPVARRTKALVLAAGLGSRLRPLTSHLPKCLVPIHDRPLLEYWFDNLAATSVEEILINTHHLREQVVDFLLAENARGRLAITEAYEPALLGSAGTVRVARTWMEDADECLIIYADNLSSMDLAQLLDFHHSHGDPFSMALFHTPTPRACGIAELDSEGRIVAFEEKPTHPKSDLANAGVYVVDAEAYREIAGTDAFDLGHDVLPKLVGRMRGWILEGYHRDIGTYESLERAHQETLAWHHGAGAASGEQLQPAVFLDRDGTVIRHVHHLTDPAQVMLLPGAAEAIARLQRNGFRCILVTNQSVIGRGLLSPAGLEAVHGELARQLAAEGVQLDGWYYCPVEPQQTDPTVIEHFDRKPGPGMLFRAAREHSLELAESWMVGDMVSDLLAGRRAGCRGSIRVGTDPLPREKTLSLEGYTCLSAPDLSQAADHILGEVAAATSPAIRPKKVD